MGRPSMVVWKLLLVGGLMVWASGWMACSCGDVVKGDPNNNNTSSGKQSNAECIPFVRGLTFSVQKEKIQVRSVAWNSKGDLFATITQDGHIQVRTTDTGILKESYRYGAVAETWSLAFHPQEDSLLSFGSDGTLRTWRNGKEEASLPPPRVALQGRAMSVGLLQRNNGSIPVVVAGYQSADNKGAVFWQSLVSTQPIPAGIQETSAPVQSVALRPDGLITAVGLADGSLELRDTWAGTRLSRLEKVHASAIQSLSWSVDGLFLASGSLDKSIKVWSVAQDPSSTMPQLVQTLHSHRYAVTSVAFAPGGKFLASSSSSPENGLLGTFRIWDVQALKPGATNPIQEIPQPSFQTRQGTWSLAWHPDPKSNKLLMGLYRGQSMVWVADDYPVFMYGRDPVGATTTLAQSRDDFKWVYGTQDGKLYVVEAPFHENKFFSRDMGSPIVRVSWDPDKSMAVAALANGQVHMWDWKENTLVSYTETKQELTSMDLRRDVLGVAAGFTDGRLVLLDSRSLVHLTTWEKLHQGAIRDIHWSHDGNLLATVGDDRMVYLWNYEGYETKPTLLTSFSIPATQQPGQIRFNADDSKLAVGMTGGKLAIWHRYTNVWKTFTSAQATSLIAWQNIDISLLITAAAPHDSIKSNVIHLWNTTQSEEEKLEYIYKWEDPKQGHQQPITSLVVNWNDQTLTTSSLDGIFKYWKLRRAYPILLVSYTASPIGLTVRPDGKQLLAGTTDTLVHMWTLNNEDTPNLTVLDGHQHSVPLLALTRKGEQLYTVALDGKLLQWDLSKTPSRKLATYPATTATFSPVTIMRGLGLNAEETHAVVGGYAATADPNNGQIAVWDLKNTSQPESVLDALPRLLAVLWHPQSQLLVSGHQTGTLRIWQKQDSVWKTTWESSVWHPLGVIHLAIDGKLGDLVASAGRYGDIRVWRLSDKKQIYRLDSGGSGISRLLFHPNGHALAASLNNGQVKIWRLRDGKLTHLLVDPDLKKEGYPTLAHDGAVNTMVWSTDGNTLFTGGEDLVIKQWHCAR